MSYDYWKTTDFAAEKAAELEAYADEVIKKMTKQDMIDYLDLFDPEEYTYEEIEDACYQMIIKDREREDPFDRWDETDARQGWDD